MARFFAKKRKGTKTPNSAKALKRQKIPENDEIEFPSDENDPLPHPTTSERHQRKIKARQQLDDFFLQERSMGETENLKEAVNDKLLASVMSNLKSSKVAMAGRISPRKRWTGRITSCTSVNCVVLLDGEESAVLGTRNCNLIKWCLGENRAEKILRRRNCSFLGSEVLSLCSRDAHVAAGCRDGSVLLLDRGLVLLRQFQHRHKGPVTGVRFGHGDMFYSCSVDRTVKCWSRASYLNTLYGHQQGVTDIDCFPSAEKLVTSGGAEGAVRVWKVQDDKQLVFSTTKSLYVDCVAVVDDEHFVTGGTRNSLQLWRTGSAKPVFYLNSAHGEGEEVWVTALQAARNTDLFVSGGSDGSVRFWRLSEDFCSFSLVSDVSLGRGFVNGVVFAGVRSVVCVVGREHRLGSWRRLTEVDNVLCVVDLQ